MEDCIFCKIIAGEIPSYKVYEDDAHLAFLNINPSSKGHSLIIPKKHSLNFMEMSNEEEKELFGAAQETAKKLKEKLGADKVFVLVMGIDVPHTHVHLLPYFEGDEWPVNLLTSVDFKPDELMEKLK